MLAKPPFVPSASVTPVTVAKFAVATSLLLKVAVAVAPTVSVPTKPVTEPSVALAVVVPSYTLLFALAVAVSAFVVIFALAVWPLASE